MEINLSNKEIKINKKINELDKFVMDFCKNLKDYVIVSGYVSILFGRSRSSEDIDLLVPVKSFYDFKIIWEKLNKNSFECINTSNPEEAFSFLTSHAIRFSRKGIPVPNMEFKKISDKIHKYSFDNKIKVILNERELFVSPIEMQIAYKLMLGKNGNMKDIEDAKHLYEIFKEKFNNIELLRLIKELNVEKEFEVIK